MNSKADELLERLNTCAFSGHRASKLGKDANRALAREALREAVSEAIASGFKHFITGGSTGFDTWAAETVLSFRENDKTLSLELAIPCLEQFSVWNKADREKYLEIKERADRLHYVTEKKYENGCMQLRNRYMVDKSSLLICYFSGSPGGTKYTADYALKQGLEVINLYEKPDID